MQACDWIICDVSWGYDLLHEVEPSQSGDVIAVGEGTIDVEHARLDMRYYECGVEAPIPDFMG